MTDETPKEFEGIDKKYLSFLEEAGFTQGVKKIRVTYTTVLPEELADKTNYHRDHLSVDRKYEEMKDVKGKLDLSLELPIENIFIEKENEEFIDLNLLTNMVDDYYCDTQESEAELVKLIKKHNIKL